MATESYVQVAPDSTGKKIRNVEVVSPGTPDTGIVEQQVTTLADSTGVLAGPFTQGADGTTATGPLTQALVNDTPNSYTVGEMRAISMTAEGRLRVSSTPSYIDQVWQHTFDNEWLDDSLPSAAGANLAFAGELNYV